MSLSRNYSKTGKKCRVTFKLSAEVAQQHGANKVKLVGDFNDWGKGEELQLKQLKDGSFSLTYSVDSGAGQEYLFKYFINDSVWENDDAPDSWVADGHGGDNSMLKVQ